MTTMSSAAKELGREPSPPIPDHDDTPYIHFALDQLTRDEEVRGSRVYPGDRSVLKRPRDSHHEPLRPSNIPLTPVEVDEMPIRVPAHRGPPKNKFLQEPKPVMIAADLDSHPTTHPAPNFSQPQPITLFPQPVPPKSPVRGDINHPMTKRPASQETFLAFEPPPGIPYMSLDVLPTVLRPVGLASFIAILTLFLAALIFAAVWSLQKGYIWTYKSFADGRYFTFQYLPLILAVLLLLWLIQIQIAIFRVTPFIALASESPKVRSRASTLPLHPTGFLTPATSFFASGQPAIACFLACAWLSLFAIPLLSASFNVHHSDTIWRWLATQGVLWVVIAIYALLLVSTIWLFACLWRRQTGLKWDPVSIADLLVVFERSNVLHMYASYFHSASDSQFREDTAARGDRLGFWRTSTRPNAAIYTIGGPGMPARRYSVVDGKIVERAATSRFSDQTVDLESGRRHSHGMTRSLLPKRFSRQSATTQGGLVFTPLVLRPAIVFLLSATFIALLIAFLVVSYLPSTSIESGFLPDLPIPVSSDGFSAANFLYSFVPSLLGLMLFLLWTHIDMTTRRLQPFANLANTHGAKMEHSLLLSYTADGPILVTIKALINRDFRVAIVSMIALLSAALPIFAGGVFWAQFYVPLQEVRISGDLSGFHALTVIFAICCFGFLALPLTARQSHRYEIPSPLGSSKLNRANSLVDIIALTHQSRLLIDHMFHAPASRIQMVTRLLTGSGNGQMPHFLTNEKRSASKISVADSIRGFGDARAGQQQTVDQGRYALGQYRGRNGKMYLGIDRASRMTGPEGQKEKDAEAGFF